MKRELLRIILAIGFARLGLLLDAGGAPATDHQMR